MLICCLYWTTFAFLEHPYFWVMVCYSLNRLPLVITASCRLLIPTFMREYDLLLICVLSLSDLGINVVKLKISCISIASPLPTNSQCWVTYLAMELSGLFCRLCEPMPSPSTVTCPNSVPACSQHCTPLGMSRSAGRETLWRHGLMGNWQQGRPYKRCTLRLQNPHPLCAQRHLF